jgi:hypothetical protein
VAGALEEAAKATGGFIETMRSQPLVLMMGLMNIVLLVFLFYYLTRITQRTEHTLELLFASNDKTFEKWTGVIKEQSNLVEKSMHCILPEDALKLLTLPPRELPAKPVPPAPLDQRGSLKGDLKGTIKPVEWQKLEIGEDRPFTFEPPKPPVGAPAKPAEKR